MLFEVNGGSFHRFCGDSMLGLYFIKRMKVVKSSLPCNQTVPTRHEARISEEKHQNKEDEYDASLDFCSGHGPQFGVFPFQDVLNNLFFLCLADIFFSTETPVGKRLVCC